MPKFPRTRAKRLYLLLAAVLAALTLAVACTSSGGKKNSPAAKAHKAGKDSASTFNQTAAPPKIVNHLDYQNFFKSQELYDDPSTIQWCTAFPASPTAPIFTVPIAGKLTSSSVSLNPGSQSKLAGHNDGQRTYNPELVSSDGMYHGSPPPYRYGFTPGGQYVDFTGLSVFCTTALTSFQRQGIVTTTIDSKADAATKRAEAALKVCNANLNPSNAGANVGTKAAACKAAQDELAGLDGGK